MPVRVPGLLRSRSARPTGLGVSLKDYQPDGDGVQDGRVAVDDGELVEALMARPHHCLVVLKERSTTLRLL